MNLFNFIANCWK